MAGEVEAQADISVAMAPVDCGPLESPFKNEPKAETLPPGERWRVWLPKDDGYNSHVVNVARDGLSTTVLSNRILDKAIVTDNEIARVSSMLANTDWDKYQHRNYFSGADNKMGEVRRVRYLLSRLTSTVRIPIENEEFPRCTSNQEACDIVTEVEGLMRPFQIQKPQAA
jgi:hypothetical protein